MIRAAATFGYGSVLGMHAFGLAENGSYAQGEEEAQLAVCQKPKDVWAINAVSYVYEMEVKHSETGIQQLVPIYGLFFKFFSFLLGGGG